MIVPMSHLNGTGKEMLLEALEAARVKLDDALAAVFATAPNQRDFYPMSNPTRMYTQAMLEHRERVNKLKTVRDELNAIADAIADGKSGEVL